MVLVVRTLLEERERWSPGYYSPSVVRTMGEDERMLDYPGFLPSFLPSFLPFLTSTDEKKKHVLRLIGRFTLSLSLSFVTLAWIVLIHIDTVDKHVIQRDKTRTTETIR